MNGNIPLKVLVTSTQEELYGPEGSADRIGIIKRGYHPASRVFTLAAGSLSSVLDAKRTIRHEVLGHFGLNTFKEEDKRALLDKILASKKQSGLKDT